MLLPVSAVARGSAVVGADLVYRWSKNEPVLALRCYFLYPLTSVLHQSLEEECEEQSLPDLSLAAYPYSQSPTLSSVSGRRARGDRHNSKIVLLYKTWAASAIGGDGLGPSLALFTI